MSLPAYLKDTGEDEHLANRHVHGESREHGSDWRQRAVDGRQSGLFLQTKQGAVDRGHLGRFDERKPS